MRESLVKLVEVQRLEDRLAIRRRRLDGLPVELGQHEARQGLLQAEAESQSLKRKQALTRARELENNARSHQDRIDSLEEKGRNLRDAGAIQVAQHEAGKLRDKIAAEEEEALALMEEGDRLQLLVTEAQHSVDVHAEELAAFQTGVQDDLHELEEEIASLEKSRGQLLKAVVRQAREHYEKILSVRDGRAVTPLRGQSCGGCGMNLPPNDRAKTEAMKTMATCRSCQRILVPQDVWSPEEAIAQEEAEIE